ELGQRLRLTQAALLAPARGPVVAGRHELDRDPAPELGIERRVDHAHPPGADAIDHDVATDALAAQERPPRRRTWPLRRRRRLERLRRAQPRSLFRGHPVPIL